MVTCFNKWFAVFILLRIENGFWDLQIVCFWIQFRTNWGPSLTTTTLMDCSPLMLCLNVPQIICCSLSHAYTQNTHKLQFLRRCHALFLTPALLCYNARFQFEFGKFENSIKEERKETVSATWAWHQRRVNTKVPHVLTLTQLRAIRQTLTITPRWKTKSSV